MRTDLTGRASALTALGLAALLGMAACDSTSVNSTGPSADGSARLTIMLKDAPGDLAEAWVVIDEIYLQGGVDCDDSDPNTDCSGDQAGREWLRDTPTDWINLLTLNDDWETLVDNAAIEPGTYRGLRFVITQAVIVTGQVVDDVTQVDGVFATNEADLDALAAVRGGDALEPTGMLICPSCPETGIKVKFPDGVIVLDDGVTIVVADFDVSQSFGMERGRANLWVMHPVIKASEMDVSGTIMGSVTNSSGTELTGSCGDASNTISIALFISKAVNADADEWTGTTDDQGNYEISAVPPGDYSMSWESEITFSDGSKVEFDGVDVDPASITLDPTGTETVDYDITSWSCTPA